MTANEATTLSRSGRTLAEGMRGHDNALNFVRLVLASSVIVGHSFPLTGIEDPTGGYLSGLGAIAVNGFFIISGYLIAASRMRMGVAPYLWRRVLRIFPAFWVMLGLTGFVFAPLSTLLTNEHWTPSAGWAFLAKNALLKMNLWGVPGTLTTVPFAEVWNGSAWTLHYEFWAYLVVGLLLTFSVVRRRGLLVFGALFVLIIVIQPLAHGPLDVSTSLYLHALRLGGYFIAGSLFYFGRNRIYLSGKVALTSAILLGLLAALHLDTWFAQLPFAYLLFWLGANLRTRIGATNDISYGIYIYAFPMQQFTFLLVGTSLGWVGHSVVAFGLTIPLALASWFYVERPAMSLARFVPKKRGSNDESGELVRR